MTCGSHESAEGASHPEELLRADAAWLAPWGCREMLRSTLLALFACTPIGLACWLLSPWWALAFLPVLAFWAFLILFFRNPRRSIPTAAGVLVAPADGTIWDLDVVDEPEFLEGPALRIGIFLSVFNVHVNRAPCDACVEWTRYVEGHYHDARSAEAARQNECQTVALSRREPGGVAASRRLLLRLISGAIAKHIVSPLRQGDELARGGLIGMIKYGSRTELWVRTDSDFTLSVGIGDKVKGGATILGNFRVPGSSPPDS